MPESWGHIGVALRWGDTPQQLYDITHVPDLFESWSHGAKNTAMVILIGTHQCDAIGYSGSNQLEKCHRKFVHLPSEVKDIMDKLYLTTFQYTWHFHTTCRCAWFSVVKTCVKWRQLARFVRIFIFWWQYSCLCTWAMCGDKSARMRGILQFNYPSHMKNVCQQHRSWPEVEWNVLLSVSFLMSLSHLLGSR